MMAPFPGSAFGQCRGGASVAGAFPSPSVAVAGLFPFGFTAGLADEHPGFPLAQLYAEHHLPGLAAKGAVFGFHALSIFCLV